MARSARWSEYVPPVDDSLIVCALLKPCPLFTSMKSIRWLPSVEVESGQPLDHVAVQLLRHPA